MLTLATLPGATVGVPYSATIGVSGGTAPYACSEAGGTLPAGLTLSAGCVVSGTPTAAGTSTVQVKATDTGTPVENVTGPESITVSPAPLTLTLATLPGATVGVPYSATIGVSGGTAPYACSQAGGTLPAGLTLSAGCVVSGTPTTAGTSTVQVKATDTSTPVETVTGPESLTVSPAPLTLTLSSLPNATVGSPYTATIGVAGGTSPYSCSIVAGTLPAGLTPRGGLRSKWYANRRRDGYAQRQGDRRRQPCRNNHWTGRTDGSGRSPDFDPHFTAECNGECAVFGNDWGHRRQGTLYLHPDRGYFARRAHLVCELRGQRNTNHGGHGNPNRQSNRLQYSSGNHYRASDRHRLAGHGNSDPQLAAERDGERPLHGYDRSSRGNGTL